MQKLKYNIFQGTAEDGNAILIPKEMTWSEVNEKIAEAEAYNGEYSIYDDGQPEPEAPESDTATWDELAAAYSEGVQSA